MILFPSAFEILIDPKNKINIKINYLYTDVLMTTYNGLISSSTSECCLSQLDTASG